MLVFFQFNNSKKVTTMASSIDELTFRNSICLQVSHQLFLDKVTADVHFLFGNDFLIEIPAHKNILAASSPFFKQLFYGTFKKDGDIKIFDASPEAFNEFLQFFYLNTVRITENHVEDVMYLADKFKVNACFSICVDFLKELNNVCLAYRLAIVHKRNDLKEFCDRKIANEPESVFISNGFNHCSPEVFKQILEIEFLPCDPELVFNGCVAWAKNMCKAKDLDESNENIRKVLGDCLRLIPFYLMHNDKIAEIIVQYEGLFSCNEITELVLIMNLNDLVPVSKFKYNRACLPPINDFCQRGYKLVKSDERISFTVENSVRIVAVKIYSLIIISNNDDSGALSGIFKMVHTNGSNDKVLLNQAVELKNMWAIVKFLKPIRCEAGKHYELRFNFNSSLYNKYYAMKTAGESEKMVVYLYYDFERN